MKIFDYKNFKENTKFEWILICKSTVPGFSSTYTCTWAAQVPTGWLIKEVSYHNDGISPALQFIEDPNHYLKITPLEEKK